MKDVKDFLITEVQISFVKPQDGLIGFASCVLSESLFISSIAIHRKLDGSGYRLTYPSKKSGTRDFDIFYPLSSKLSKAIELAIFSKLENILDV